MEKHIDKILGEFDGMIANLESLQHTDAAADLRIMFDKIRFIKANSNQTVITDVSSLETNQDS